jgi:peptidoglycan/LPS O-acetylase OafA/YrhL
MEKGLLFFTFTDKALAMPSGRVPKSSAQADQPAQIGPAIAPMPLDGGERRFIELDALRGIAACIVVFFHYGTVPKELPSWQQNLYYNTPFFLFGCGTQAVVFFFVLSGFVLSLPYTRGSGDPYHAFIVKRIFRIYVPYVVVLAFAIWGAATFHGELAEYNAGLKEQWFWPVGSRIIVQHILLLGGHLTQFDPPVWSIVQEMRISLLFPFLCLFILRLPTLGALALVPLLSLAEELLRSQHLIPNDLFFLDYIGMFVMGIILANHRSALRNWINSQSVLVYVVLLLATLVCLWVSFSHFYLNEFAELAAVVLIIISLGENQISRFLRIPIPQFLGHISYSIYLIHFPFMLLMLHLFHGAMPLIWILVPTFFLTILTSALFYRLVELPSMQMGRQIARRLKLRAANSRSKQAA